MLTQDRFLENELEKVHKQRCPLLDGTSLGLEYSLTRKRRELPLRRLELLLQLVLYYHALVNHLIVIDGVNYSVLRCKSRRGLP